MLKELRFLTQRDFANLFPAARRLTGNRVAVCVGDPWQEIEDVITLTALGHRRHLQN